MEKFYYKFINADGSTMFMRPQFDFVEAEDVFSAAMNLYRRFKDDEGMVVEPNHHNINEHGVTIYSGEVWPDGKRLARFFVMRNHQQKTTAVKFIVVRTKTGFYRLIQGDKPYTSQQHVDIARDNDIPENLVVGGGFIDSSTKAIFGRSQKFGNYDVDLVSQLMPGWNVQKSSDRLPE